MAKDGKIRKEDLFDDSAFQAIKDISEGLSKLAKSFKDALSDAQKLNKEISKSQAMKDLNKQTVEATKTQNALTYANKQFEVRMERLALQAERTATAKEKFNKQQVQGAKNTNTWGRALTSFMFKFNALGNIVANVAAKAWQMFTRAVRGALNVVKDFNEATTRLQSITGKTKDEIKGLVDQAKQLGAQTRFTATQVTSLQIELSKLGFTIDEISASTPGILKFASATGADLADAAKVAGVAIRAFGLSTAETETTVATLAVATTKSALQFSDFEKILSTVGPVARSFGFTIQDTVALLGKLRDAGFDASTAATATRNIFLNLANSSGRLSQALGSTPKNFEELITGLVTLRERGVDLNKTLELTDKRSVAAFNQFIQTAEGASELRDSITGVNSELDTMVETNLKSLSAQLDIIKSAWQGFILSLEQGDGVIATLVTGSLKLLTDALTQLSNLDLIFTRSGKMTEEQFERTFDVMMNFQRNSDGLKFQNVINEFDKVDYALLKFDDEMQNNFMSAMKGAGFAAWESFKIWQVYLGRREEQFETELKAQQAYQDRITEQKRNEVALFKDAEEEKNKAQAEEMRKIFANLELMDSEFERFYEGVIEQGWMTKPWSLAKEAADEAVDWTKDALDSILDNVKETIQEENDERQRQLDFERDLNHLRVDMARQAYHTLGGFIDDHLWKQREAMRHEMQMAGDSVEARAAIEEKYRRKLKGLQIAAAVVQRAAALFEIKINTAVAVSKAMTNPLTIPLIPFIKALGIAQAVAVATAPIPKFAKGVDDSPEGPAIIGEKGSELMIDRQGNVGLSPATSTLTYLQRGTKIIPADLTEDIMRGETNKDSKLVSEIRESNTLLRNLVGKPVHRVNINSAGVTVLTQRGNTLTKRIDKYFR